MNAGRARLALRTPTTLALLPATTLALLPATTLALLAATTLSVLALAAGCAPVQGTQAPPSTTGAPPQPSRPGGEPTPVPPPPRPLTGFGQAEPRLEIGLAWDLDSTSVRYTGLQTVEVQSHDRPGVHSTAGPLALRVSGSQLLVTPRDHARAVPLLVLHGGDTLWVGSEALASGDAGSLEWNGRHWRGRFKLFLNPRGKLTVVTRLPLERYLLGVVPGEIGALNDSLLEAGRAQAVAARSYTLFYQGRRGSEGFDLYGTVEDQVYGPVETERPLASRCVESTRGLVGLADGAPIRANYCSTCGGISAEAWEAWPTPGYSYLTCHADAGSHGDYCSASPQYRWREEWTAKEFAANLAKFGPQFGVALPPGGVGEIADVRVLQRSRSGRVWWLVVTTSTGEIDIHAHSLRQMLRRGGNPSAILRSTLFKIAVRRDPRTRKAIAVVASGAGSGHGVGLCQTGALAMARQGARGEAILAHYFPGAALQRLY